MNCQLSPYGECFGSAVEGRLLKWRSLDTEPTSKALEYVESAYEDGKCDKGCVNVCVASAKSRS